MLRTSAVLLSFGSLLIATACVCPESHEHGNAEHAVAAKKSSEESDSGGNSKFCKHHIEEPFEIKPGGAGAGIVYGSADFGAAGGVVIKVQVEDTNPNSHTATVTVWSGSDANQVSGASVPSGAQQVFTSGGDVNLRFWTTHLDRSCPLGSTDYYLITRVDYRMSDGSQQSSYYFNGWPSPAFGSSTADQPHDFSGL